MAVMDINPTALFSILRSLTDITKFCIAYSGGIDSQVLLHSMKALCNAFPIYEIRAIHVNHGISSHANAWQMHCQKSCEEWQIPFASYSIAIVKTPGESLENLARQARYQCLSEHLNSDEYLLTAHNADDQAETVLLQLLRGAGVEGLAAMPVKKTLVQGTLLRPLLSFSRAQIEKYAQKNKLLWIEDESNTDLRFDRNFLRHQVMPIIKRRWPQALTTIGRSALHCAEAKRLLFDISARDLSVILSEHSSLDIDKLLDLPLLRQQHVIRYWITQQGYLSPSKTQLEELFKAVIHARPDANPVFKWPSQEIRRYRRKLYLFKKQDTVIFPERIVWDLKKYLTLPNNLGSIYLKELAGGGLRLNKNKQSYSIRFRQGGEVITPAGRHEQHTLKKLFQEWGVPPWLRDQVPLLYEEDQLIAVVGYTIAAAFMADSDETSFIPILEPV